MATAIICLILIIIGVCAVRGYRKRLTSGCCGTSSGPSVKKIKVKDKDASHYPYESILYVDGMSCGNCVSHVENALNSLEGVWASVDLGTEEARVRMKEQLPDEVLKEAVKAAGYRVYKIKQPDNFSQ
ncbi:heavy-metal-associated domain-containing protein [Lacrimispora sp. 210928-DFI.3.58]|uniref:heavy-metal-associated domain-containing protein n=1 Tax=Lacrimispora sp. 210928-DFI.3.58 TaxID=2883214 RepID=UPI0015B6E298|nr:heavy metal-associated domain-containing protein [Lacrimispora sp. 210928-DFI.3.58]MCB7317780.1 heavy-metal-associated domain-containing protein [Lacrimispora sp. 210928-DFI.3.58]